MDRDNLGARVLNLWFISQAAVQFVARARISIAVDFITNRCYVWKHVIRNTRAVIRQALSVITSPKIVPSPSPMSLEAISLSLICPIRRLLSTANTVSVF